MNIGLIGAGYWGRNVIREILSLSKKSGLVTLRSVVDNSPTTLEQCNQEFGTLDYRLDYRSLLSDQTIDAVYIASPNPTHYELASSFMEHGKDVLVEKPLALTSKEAYDLVKISERNNVVLSVGHIHRFNNAVRELRRAIASGVLGNLYYLRFRWTGFLLPQNDRDVVMDLGPHPFDISNLLLGQWPTEITCRGRGIRTPDNEEVAFITAEYEDQLSVNIELSWLDRQKHRDITAVGSEGIANVDCSSQEAVLVRSDRTERVPIISSNVLAMQITHFVECVRNRSLSRPIANLCPGTLGAAVVQLTEAAKKSLREKRTVSVATEPEEALNVSQKDRTMLELVWEPSSELYPKTLWGPSSVDPDYSMPSDTVSASVEARIRTSRHRTKILLVLGASDATPKKLASAVGLELSNLSKYLNDLVYHGLVERKTHFDVRKGRIYGLTEKGRKFSRKLAQGTSLREQ